MKQLSHLLTLLLLFIHLDGKAQTNIQNDQHVDPVLKQVAAKLPGLKIFNRKGARGGYVNMAVLDEKARLIKWFTCYGVAFDSLQLSNNEYSQLAAGTSDPFTFYRTYCYESLRRVGYAELQYRLHGKPVLQDTFRNSRAVFDADPVRSAQTTLQKLMAIEGLMKRISVQLSVFDSRPPRRATITRANSSVVRQNYAGMMVRRADSTEYYNTDPLATASKIVLRRQSPDKLFVYNDTGSLLDSVPLKPGKYASLLKEKEDVFLLYRGWLEFKWQQIADASKQYEKWLQGLDSSLYRSVSWEQHRRQLLNLAIGLQEQQRSIDSKINTLIAPDQDYVEQLVARVHANERTELSYLPGLGFGYTISYIRGQKSYELTDHRNNIVTVVSDKKKGQDENADGLVEYYNADVISVADYYPFGMYQPGRTYRAGDKYRYGYNGKENDNEVKGEGNQQDYGMRIYDPRIAKFLSIDPLSVQYPELTPYQFASNTPIWGVDRDGLEIEPFQMLRAQQRIRENRAKMTPEQLKRDNQLSLTLGVGVSALPIAIYAAPSAVPLLTSGAVTSSAIRTAVTATTSAAVWASRNPQALKEGGDFVLGLLNPTPQDIDPTSSSDEFGRAINEGFRYVIKGLSFGGKFIGGIKRVSFAADQIKNLISTEEHAQGGVEAIKKILTSGNEYQISKIWSGDIVTTTYNNKTYILDGHNRLKALAELGWATPAEARVLEISTEEAMKSYKDVMEYIKKDEFNLKISE